MSETNSPGGAGSPGTRPIARLSSEAAANMDIGVFGQQEGMQIYTQITYVFDLPSITEKKREIIETLQAGLDRLVAAFPWLGGQVILNKGRRHFAPASPPRIFVKVLSLSFSALRDSGFPFWLLDESDVAPRRTLPSPDEGAEMPVLLVQANFIKGGLLLTIVAHHATMDMGGQTAVTRWFAKACRGEGFTEAELDIGNCERRTMVDLLSDDEGGQDPFAIIPEQVIPPSTLILPPSPVAPVCVWSYFEFSAAGLATLKAEATATLPTKDSFVSTDDAFSAFLWQSILRARRPRLLTESTSSSPTSSPPLSTLARAIDVRRYMGVTTDYPGLLQNMTLHIDTVAWVCSASLGEVAARLRSEIQPDRLRLRTRAYATCVSGYPDEASSRLSFIGHVDTGAGGLMLSSWKTAPGIDTDFGLEGVLPTVVRRPQFTPVESLLYLMPPNKDGSTAAGLCLREADLARLRTDPVFGKYGRYVG